MKVHQDVVDLCWIRTFRFVSPYISRLYRVYQVGSAIYWIFGSRQSKQYNIRWWIFHSQRKQGFGKFASNWTVLPSTWLQRTGAYWKQIMDKKQFSGSKCIAHSAIFLFKVTHQPFEVEVADLEQMWKLLWKSSCSIVSFNFAKEIYNEKIVINIQVVSILFL